MQHLWPLCEPSSWSLNFTIVFFKKFWSYLNFFKPQQAPTEHGMSFNLRAMHTINRISIFMLLGAIIFLFFKWVVF